MDPPTGDAEEDRWILIDDEKRRSVDRGNGDRRGDLHCCRNSKKVPTTVQIDLHCCRTFALLLQMSDKSNQRADIKNLQRRLVLWDKGEIEELLLECSAIQKALLKKQKKRGNQSVAKTFANNMKRGKVGAAIANLSGDPGGGVLQLQEEVVNKNKKKTVIEHLLDLHPRQRTIQSEAVIDNCEDEHIFHPVLFDRITGGLIRKSAMQLRGAAGPSATDAVQWKRFLTEHKQASNTLCQSVAGVARKLCTQHVAPDYINNLRDSRLIPLDKMPGIRPIGISEVLRRLIGKAALSVLKPYIREVAGNKQLSAGHEAGCEAAIHAIRKMFTDHECEGLLLVDAENAFNELNRQTALRNIQVLCPGFSKICTNFYREPSVRRRNHTR